MNEVNHKKNKQIIFSIVGVLLLIVAVVGVTYAFFNYTRTGSANTVRTGTINFNTTQSGTINMTNVFPVANANSITGDNTTAVINVAGNTTYSGGIV